MTKPPMGGASSCHSTQVWAGYKGFAAEKPGFFLGGTGAIGTADPKFLAANFNVIAICVDYLQSGDRDHSVPYGCGYLQAAGIDVETPFITDSDLDGKVFKNTGHGVGDRTLIVNHFARKYLVPGSPTARVRQGKCDFELGCC